jgi:hypothetical protein
METSSTRRKYAKCTHNRETWRCKYEGYIKVDLIEISVKYVQLAEEMRRGDEGPCEHGNETSSSTEALLNSWLA